MKCAALRALAALVLALSALPAQAQFQGTPPSDPVLSLLKVSESDAVLSFDWTPATTPVGAPTLDGYSFHLIEAGGTFDDNALYNDLPEGADVGGVTVEQFISFSGQLSFSVAARQGAKPMLFVVGLKPGTTYEARIRADAASQFSDWSDVARAFTATVADAPSGLSAVPGADATKLALAWTAPFGGGVDISDYKVRWSAGAGSANWNDADGVSTGSAGATHTLTGLVSGTTYEVQVAAVNTLGRGAFGASARGVAGASARAPGVVPEDSVQVQNGDGMATLSWDVPADSGGAVISGYRLRWRAAGGAWQKSSGPTDPANSEDGEEVSARAYAIALANGGAYGVQIAAVNSAGVGAWSKSYFIMPLGVPNAPVMEPLIADRGSMLALWAAPTDNGGASIQLYRIRWRVSAAQGSPPGNWLTSNGRAIFPGDDALGLDANKPSYKIRSLINGATYDAQVAAETLNGLGAWSELQMAAPRARMADAPSGPVELTALVPGDATLALSWAQLTEGSEVITRYCLRWRVADDGTGKPGGWQKAAGATDRADPEDCEMVTGTSYTITGLVNGTTYEVQLTPANDSGVGYWDLIPHTGTPRAAATLDLNGNGSASWQEGVMIARYSLGLRGEALVAGLGLNLPENSLSRIPEIDKLTGSIALGMKTGGEFDVDGVSGITAADGILIARYLLGVTGDALIKGQTTSVTAVALETALAALEP